MRTLPCFVYNKRVALFEHRGVFADQAEARANPLIRQRSVGSYFTMKCDHSLKGAGDAKYNARDIKVIDHNRQTWKTITFMDALRNSGLFDANGELNDWGKRVLFPRYTGNVFTFAALLGQYGPEVTRHYATQAAAYVGARDVPKDLRTLFKGTKPVDLIVGLTPITSKAGKDIDAVDKQIKLFRDIVEDIYAAALQDEFKKAVETPTNPIPKGVERILKAKLEPGSYAQALENIKTLATRADVTDGDKNVATTQNYGAPLNIENIQSLINDGFQVPIQLYILRPHQTFRMGAMIMGKGGEETGFTVFGNANFELSDEATTKTAIGHYTCKFLPNFPQLALACVGFVINLSQPTPTIANWR